LVSVVAVRKPTGIEGGDFGRTAEALDDRERLVGAEGTDPDEIAATAREHAGFGRWVFRASRRWILIIQRRRKNRRLPSVGTAIPFVRIAGIASPAPLATARTNRAQL
jgi:hypothetical protein